MPLPQRLKALVADLKSALGKNQVRAADLIGTIADDFPDHAVEAFRSATHMQPTSPVRNVHAACDGPAFAAPTLLDQLSTLARAGTGAPCPLDAGRWQPDIPWVQEGSA